MAAIGIHSRVLTNEESTISAETTFAPEVPKALHRDTLGDSALVFCTAGDPGNLDCGTIILINTKLSLSKGISNEQQEWYGRTRTCLDPLSSNS
jgi:hypothetical protein